MDSQKQKNTEALVKMFNNMERAIMSNQKMIAAIDNVLKAQGELLESHEKMMDFLMGKHKS